MELPSLGGSNIRDGTQKPLNYSSGFIFAKDVSPIMRSSPSHKPRDFRKNDIWINYLKLLKEKICSYNSSLKNATVFSVVLYYAVVAGLPFGLMSYAVEPEAAHLLYAVYVGISTCLEVYLCWLFSKTDRSLDELEDKVHEELRSVYQSIVMQEEEKETTVPRSLTALALVWGQLSRLDTYLHMCFVATLSHDERHSILWGLSLGLILLFLVFYNWTLYVLQSEGRQGLNISRVTRHLSSYLDYCGLYLVSSHCCETQEFNPQTFELLDIPATIEKGNEAITPAAFRYIKWISEDAAQSVLLLLYLHLEDTSPLVAYSAAVSLLMLLSGLLLLLFRKRLRVLLW